MRKTNSGQIRFLLYALCIPPYRPFPMLSTAGFHISIPLPPPRLSVSAHGSWRSRYHTTFVRGKFEWPRKYKSVICSNWKTILFIQYVYCTAQKIRFFYVESDHFRKVHLYTWKSANADFQSPYLYIVLSIRQKQSFFVQPGRQFLFSFGWKDLPWFCRSIFIGLIRILFPNISNQPVAVTTIP